MRLTSDSQIGYDSEDGPFAREMSVEDKAIQWLVQLTQDTGIELYGGYYGPAYIYEGVLFVVDPGHESQKYSGLDAYKVEDVVALYTKLHDDNYKCDDVSCEYYGDCSGKEALACACDELCWPQAHVYDLIEEIQIELQGV